MRVPHCQCDICEKTIDGNIRHAELQLSRNCITYFIIEVCAECEQILTEQYLKAHRFSDFGIRQTPK